VCDERAGEVEGGGVIAIGQPGPGGIDHVYPNDRLHEYEMIRQLDDQVDVVLVDPT
jgi:hypothetical protein